MLSRLHAGEAAGPGAREQAASVALAEAVQWSAAVCTAGGLSHTAISSGL